MRLAGRRYCLGLDRERYLSNLQPWLTDPSEYEYAIPWIMDVLRPEASADLRRQVVAHLKSLDGVGGRTDEGRRRWADFIDFALDGEISLMEECRDELLAWPNSYRPAYEAHLHQLEEGDSLLRSLRRS